MGLGVLVDRDKKHVTYNLVLRGETGWVANEISTWIAIIELQPQDRRLAGRCW